MAKTLIFDSWFWSKFVMTILTFLEVLEHFTWTQSIEEKIRKNFFFRTMAWFWSFLKELALTKSKTGKWPYLAYTASNRLENTFFNITHFMIFWGSKVDFGHFWGLKIDFWRPTPKKYFYKKFNHFQNRTPHFLAHVVGFRMVSSFLIFDQNSWRYGLHKSQVMIFWGSIWSDFNHLVLHEF